MTRGAATVDGVLERGTVLPVRILASEPYEEEWAIPDMELLRRAALAADEGVLRAACAAAYRATCGRVLAGS